MNGWKGWILGMAGVLIVYGVQGTIRTAYAQSKLQAEVKQNTEEIERRRATITSVIRLETDVAHIKEDVVELRDGQKEILKAISEIE